MRRLSLQVYVGHADRQVDGLHAKSRLKTLQSLPPVEVSVGVSQVAYGSSAMAYDRLVGAEAEGEVAAFDVDFGPWRRIAGGFQNIAMCARWASSFVW